jgi:hypothetical protein
MKNAALTILALGLAGCMSINKPIDPSKLTQLKPGVSTEADAIALLGEPTSSRYMPNGGKMLFYASAKTDINPAAFIPYVGLAFMHVDTKNQSAQLLFGPDGKLTTNYADAMGIKMPAIPAYPMPPPKP